MPNKSIGAAAVILDDAGRVLLVKHSYGKLNWELPGGKAEENESAQETARREVLEETGLDVTVGQLTGIYYDPEYDMHHFVFLARCGGTGKPLPSSPEITECRFCAPADLPRPMSDFTRKRIREALKPEGRPDVHVIGPRRWIE
ncbi:NUDIX hydrolase [Paenibacillus humicola]|uniref:NUDIX hydrolase n=1 Tax=Paenibacillus humicola TaxID=3110540 RepID=UPI00237BF572|nr:NUDIX domain-containing protein [Paenibacillus humicola]